MIAQALTDTYRPRSVAEFVGLEKPKRAMGALLARPFPSSWLFVGPPGVGKTSMGLAVAAEMPCRVAPYPVATLRLGNDRRGDADVPLRPDVPIGRPDASCTDRRSRPYDATRSTGVAVQVGRDRVSACYGLCLHRECYRWVREAFPQSLPRARVLKLWLRATQGHGTRPCAIPR